MAVYIHKRLDKIFSKAGITDADLCKAATEVKRGEFEADLGGGVIKKRLRLAAGKSKGARSVVFFKQGDRLFFYDGWPKNTTKKGTKEIEDDRLEDYKILAKGYLKATQQQIEQLKASGTFREVNCNDEKNSGRTRNN